MKIKKNTEHLIVTSRRQKYLVNIYFTENVIIISSNSTCSSILRNENRYAIVNEDDILRTWKTHFKTYLDYDDMMKAYKGSELMRHAQKVDSRY